MSGGTWNYAQFKIEERAGFAARGLTLLAELEHIMDWALAGDTRRDEAVAEIWDKLELFFYREFGN